MEVAGRIFNEEWRIVRTVFGDGNEQFTVEQSYSQREEVGASFGWCTPCTDGDSVHLRFDSAKASLADHRSAFEALVEKRKREKEEEAKAAEASRIVSEDVVYHSED